MRRIAEALMAAEMAATAASAEINGGFSCPKESNAALTATDRAAPAKRNRASERPPLHFPLLLSFVMLSSLGAWPLLAGG